MAAEATPNVTSPPLILAVETSSRIGSVAIALGGQVLAESQFSPAPTGCVAPEPGPAPARPVGAGLRHSAEIFPAIRSLLDRFGRRPAEVEHVYISGGPGSFTGLRIAATLAKIMHLANGARIVAVDTLDVIAANVISLTNTQISDFPPHGVPCGRFSAARRPWRETCDLKSTTGNCQSPIIGRIAGVLDAKRGQFFIAVYQREAHDEPKVTRGGIWTKVLPDSLMTIAEFLARFAHREEPVWLLGDGLVYYRDKFQADGVRFFDEKFWSPQARNVHLLGWKMACRGQFAEPLTLTPTYLRKPDVIIKPR